MPWFKVDDGFHSDEKVTALAAERGIVGMAALGLWARAGSWCADKLTDGFVPKVVAKSLGSRPKVVAKLIESGLWVEVEGGYRFPTWSKFQPSKADVERDRETNRKRQDRWRWKRKVEATRNGVTQPLANTVSNGAPDPTRPDPIQLPPVAPPGAAPRDTEPPSPEPEPLPPLEQAYADQRRAAECYVEATGQTDCHEPWSAAQRQALAKMCAWCNRDWAKLSAELRRLKRQDTWLTGKRIGQWAENLGTGDPASGGVAPPGRPEDFTNDTPDWLAPPASEAST